MRKQRDQCEGGRSRGAYDSDELIRDPSLTQPRSS